MSGPRPGRGGTEALTFHGAARWLDAFVQRPLVWLAVAEAVVEDQCSERRGRHGDVEAREVGVAPRRDVGQVDEEGEVAVPSVPRLARLRPPRAKSYGLALAGAASREGGAL